MRWPLLLLLIFSVAGLNGCGGERLALKMAPAVGVFGLSQARERPLLKTEPPRASLIYAESSGFALVEDK
ncbi:hypothetical protein [Thermosulfuriphilus sp.]